MASILDPQLGDTRLPLRAPARSVRRLGCREHASRHHSADCAKPLFSLRKPGCAHAMEDVWFNNSQCTNTIQRRQSAESLFFMAPVSITGSSRIKRRQVERPDQETQ